MSDKTDNSNMDFISKLDTLLSTIKDRLNWNKYFMSLALLASQRSACERLKVGCVIVKDKRVVCTGYNGFLPGGPHISRVRANHEQSTVHAEQNAISDAASRMVSVKEADAYVTHYPCINCFKTLVAAHVKNIYYRHNYKNDELVNLMAVENGVKIIKI